jgi:hypothetical protein
LLELVSAAGLVSGGWLIVEPLLLESIQPAAIATQPKSPTTSPPRTAEPKEVPKK